MLHKGYDRKGLVEKRKSLVVILKRFGAKISGKLLLFLPLVSL
jgi:hypothetical protein